MMKEGLIVSECGTSGRETNQMAWLRHRDACLQKAFTVSDSGAALIDLRAKKPW